MKKIIIGMLLVVTTFALNNSHALDFNKLSNETIIELQKKTYITCQVCRGTGKTVCPNKVANTTKCVTRQKCKGCKGAGKQSIAKTVNGKLTYETRICSACKGEKYLTSPCSTCGSGGKVICKNCNGSKRVLVNTR